MSRTQEENYHLTGMLMAAGAALLWSTSGLFIKLLTVDSFALAGLRSLVAGLVFLPFIKPRLIKFSPWLVVMVLGFAHTQLAFITATRWTTAANAIAMQSTLPAWIWLLTFLQHRGRPYRLFLPILVILAGVMVLLMEPALGNSHEGNLLALTAGLGFAFTQLGISRARIPAISAVCLANLGASVVAFALKPEVFVGISLPAQEWVSILYLGAGQIGLGMLLFALAMRRIPVAQAAVLSVLEPIFNPLWVFLVVGESPTHFGLVGWGVILVGILLDVLLRRKGSLAGPTQVKTESSV